MLPKEAIQKVMDAYYHITGLRCYFVQDETEISSAKEKNFFCKCLKTSSSALRQCDECTFENYTGALKSNEPQKYACHAGLVKWSVPRISCRCKRCNCIRRCYHKTARLRSTRLGQSFS